MIRLLLPHFRPYRRRVAGGLAAILAKVVVGMAAPLLVGHAVDAFRRETSASTLLGYGGVLILVALIQGVFSYLQRMVLVGVSRDIEFDLRNEYFAHLERQPPQFFHQRYTGDLMARATNDLQAVRMICGPAVMYAANTVFEAAGALFFMARIHWSLTLLALATMPFVAFATKLFGERIHRHFERVQDRFSALSARVQENFAGVRVVRAYAREDEEQRAFAEVNREYLQANRRLIRWSAAFHPLLQMLIGLGFATVLWYGGQLALRGRITVGEFVTFNLFLGKLVWPMIAVGWVINLVQRGSASWARIREVLATEPAVRDEEPLQAAAIRGSVELRRLTFTYPDAGEPALRDLDLEVRAGQTVAVVGRTGAGKSSLLQLLPRLFDPPPGTLLLDGVDARRLRLAELRAAIAMVPQETFLFSATVAENIALGKPTASRAEVERAAELAGLADDLLELPQGLDTVVGERGVTLSGGQRQRVALARALLRAPAILLLDDCLSAVDAATEARILDNLRQVFPGRTVFQVSHRVSAVRDADLILVLDRGRIAERGRHDELVEKGGLYADLHLRQQLEAELEAV